MDTKEWLQQATDQKDLLLGFVRSWHPASNTCDDDIDLPITAEGAEQACNVIRTQIAATGLRNLTDEWNTALSKGDARGLYSLMNSAWFGVPESTGCWGIQGFREAVALLEDPPEDDDDMPENVIDAKELL